MQRAKQDRVRPTILFSTKELDNSRQDDSTLCESKRMESLFLHSLTKLSSCHIMITYWLQQSQEFEARSHYECSLQIREELFSAPASL